MKPSQRRALDRRLRLVRETPAPDSFPPVEITHIREKRDWSGTIVLLVALAGLFITAAFMNGCGASAVQLETARVAACEGAEAGIEEAYERGEMSREEAIGAIDCTRSACDALHRRIVEAE